MARDLTCKWTGGLPHAFWGGYPGSPDPVRRGAPRAPAQEIAGASALQRQREANAAQLRFGTAQSRPASVLERTEVRALVDDHGHPRGYRFRFSEGGHVGSLRITLNASNGREILSETHKLSGTRTKRPIDVAGPYKNAFVTLELLDPDGAVLASHAPRVGGRENVRNPG